MRALVCLTFLVVCLIICGCKAGNCRCTTSCDCHPVCDCGPK